MIRNIIILLTHDLAVAFKNKTLYLIVCMPLFVYATLMLVDPAKAHDARMKLAWLERLTIQTPQPTPACGHPSHGGELLKSPPVEGCRNGGVGFSTYRETTSSAPAQLKSLEQHPELFSVRRVTNEDEANQLLGAREVDGILTPTGSDVPQLRLTVVRQASVETLAILQRLSALQIAVECQNPGWISDVRPLQTSSIKQQTLPTWILMMVLLVSFIVLPAQVAEEKEKQLLLGWMQTPVRESEWLAAKLVYSIFLMLTAVLVLQVMAGEFSCAHAAGSLAILCAGGFCFGALGICLGLLCRNQASARTLGVLCYLPLLLPAALSDLSQELRHIAPWIPSYYVYEPIRSMLLDNSTPGNFLRAVITLISIGLLACVASYRLIQKRWLM